MAIWRKCESASPQVSPLMWLCWWAEISRIAAQQMFSTHDHDDWLYNEYTSPERWEDNCWGQGRNGNMMAGFWEACLAPPWIIKQCLMIVCSKAGRCLSIKCDLKALSHSVEGVDGVFYCIVCPLPGWLGRFTVSRLPRYSAAIDLCRDSSF